LWGSINVAEGLPNAAAAAATGIAAAGTPALPSSTFSS